DVILEACRRQGDRPVPWCLIDRVSENSARLAVRLTQSWGAGIVCLTSNSEWLGDHGLSVEEGEIVQRHCRVRVWWGNKEQIDPFFVLTALSHGCLPLQWVSEEDHEELMARLPEGLEAFTAPLPTAGPLPSMADDDLEQRLDRGLSAILAGTLERELAR